MTDKYIMKYEFIRNCGFSVNLNESIIASYICRMGHVFTKLDKYLMGYSSNFRIEKRERKESV